MIRHFTVGFSRILVGTLFIFSGLIKANDPLGFSYKLEEYWVEFGMNWKWLISLGVPLAVFLCVLEIVLGVATLVGYKMKIVSRLLLLLMAFFTVLTFASAVFGLVKSCGCFGDAIPLTPWQSFIKDVILIILVVVLFGDGEKIKPYANRYWETAFVVFPTVLMAYAAYLVDWQFPLYYTLAILGFGFITYLANLRFGPLWTVIISLISALWFSIHVIDHLPMRDFRPYAVGKNIPDQMQLPEGAKPDIYRNTFLYKNLTTGKVEEFDDSNYPWDDENYEFVDRETVLIEKGDEAKITDLSIMDVDGYNLTEDILNDPDPVLLVISYNVLKAGSRNIKDLSKLVKQCNAKGFSAVGLSASDPTMVDEFKSANDLEIPFYATDEITLKTIVRSNPGLVLLEGGTVKAKWHVNDVPTFEELTGN
ncbi:MAG: DoxX family protein [Vicingaceae bacterium]